MEGSSQIDLAARLLRMAASLQAASVGMAVSGFGVSALSFATVWATPSDASMAPRTPAQVAPAATAYFAVSAALTAAAIGAYFALDYLPYWRHHSAASLAGTRACAGLLDSWLWVGVRNTLCCALQAQNGRPRPTSRTRAGS